MKRFLLCALLLAAPLAGCASTPQHTSLAAPAPVFSPFAFFDGKTVGEGTLKVDFSDPTHTHVVSAGHIEPDGTLILVQHITERDEPVHTRTWRIQKTDDGRLTGTLTSARGPVHLDVEGNRLHIRFTTKHGLDTEQWLYLQPGGRVALNRMVVRKFAFPLASLDETITRRN
ncbi:DUF3833 family protein [Pararhizobium mangrovi]|nr:DUF3833 family protein [Pararhizobium mangrovi]